MLKTTVKSLNYCISSKFLTHYNSIRTIWCHQLQNRLQTKEIVADPSHHNHRIHIRNFSDNNNKGIVKMETKEELRKRLTSIQYQVTQESATERPFTGKYNKCYDKGIYRCIVCHLELFTSDTKYDSGCGWPAFNDVLDQGKITLHKDCSISGTNLLLLLKNPDRIRTEVRCKCGAHMGHVFDDGPKPTRKRYCINSAAIEFIPAEELNKS